MKKKFSRFEEIVVRRTSAAKIKFSRQFSIALLMMSFVILLFGPFFSLRYEFGALALLFAIFSASIYIVTKYQELILKLLDKD